MPSRCAGGIFNTFPFCALRAFASLWLKKLPLDCLHSSEYNHIIMQIAVFASLNRPHALDVARQLIAWLHEHGHTVRLNPALGRAVNCLEHRVPDELVLTDADLAISVGGDGTMLGVVRLAAPLRVPVLAVHAGALGFLTELTPEELPEYLPRVLAGEYELVPRMMLNGKLLREGEVYAEDEALNDIVIRQGATGRLIKLTVLVCGHQLSRMSADGLIASTPTGSTAYGLSAGGPIVHPATSVTILVPICPHSLTFRPLVVPATDPIEIICEGNAHSDDMLVTFDGQEPIPVQTGDRILITPAKDNALLVKLGLSMFYDRLREKLQWGGR